MQDSRITLDPHSAVVFVKLVNMIRKTREQCGIATSIERTVQIIFEQPEILRGFQK